MIENNFSALELAQQYKEVVRQRDELLAALQLLLEQDDRREDEIWVRNKARAAIRSVKGGAA